MMYFLNLSKVQKQAMRKSIEHSGGIMILSSSSRIEYLSFSKSTKLVNSNFVNLRPTANGHSHHLGQF